MSACYLVEVVSYLSDQSSAVGQTFTLDYWAEISFWEKPAPNHRPFFPWAVRLQERCLLLSSIDRLSTLSYLSKTNLSDDITFFFCVATLIFNKGQKKVFGSLVNNILVVFCFHFLLFWGDLNKKEESWRQTSFLPSHHISQNLRE